MRIKDFQSDFYDICNERNIKGAIIDNGENLIITAGLYEVPENYNEIITEQSRYDTLFYPLKFAIIIDENNDLDSMQQFIDYAQKAELIKVLYDSVGLDIPERLRNEEVSLLQMCNENQWNPKHNTTFQTANTIEIENFFKEEKKKGFISRAWRNYTRSPRYDANASWLRRFIDFFKTHKQVVKLEVLQKHTDTIRKITLTEPEYKILKEYVKVNYPDIVYSSSPIRTYKSKTKQNIDTGDEATSTKKGTVVYKHRDVFIREEDSSLFAGIYNTLRYSTVGQTPLNQLEAGKLSYIKIPHEYAESFLGIMKKYDIYFAIDNGKYTKNDLDSINVLYGRANEDMVQNIVRAIVTSHSREHSISEYQRQAAIDFSFSSPSRTKNITK